MKTKASTYERVIFQDDKGRKTVILRDPEDITFQGHPAISGIEVNKEGDEVASGGADVRRRIIGADLVSKRRPMSMNKKYGTLEVHK